MERNEAIRTVLGVWAHPDDESYLSAGLMMRARSAGARVVCATATAGESGTNDPHAWPPRRLARRRTAELRRALKVIGVHSHRLLGFADGRCAEVTDEAGATVIGAMLDELAPDLVVTFGPDGITGHPDHRSVSRWTTLAWAKRDRPGALLYATVTDEFERRFRAVHQALGVFPPGYPVTSRPADVALELRLTSTELDRKRAALAAHHSQTAGLAQAMGEATFRHWWGVETFRAPREDEIPPASVDEARRVS